MKKLYFFIFTVIFTTFISCKEAYKKEALSEVKLITVKNSQFYKGDKPYYFVGTNYWYGPLIGAKKSGDRQRLKKEFDPAGVFNPGRMYPDL